MVKLEAIVASKNPNNSPCSSSSPPLPSPNSHLHLNNNNNPPLLPHLQYPQPPQATYYNNPYPNYEYQNYNYNNYNPLIFVPLPTIQFQYPFLSPTCYYHFPDIIPCPYPVPYHFDPQPQQAYTSGSHCHVVAVGSRAVDGNRNRNGNHQNKKRNGVLGRKGYRNGGHQVWKPKGTSSGTDNNENGNGNGNGNDKMKMKGKEKQCGPRSLHPRPCTTTVMIKNIPNRVSRKELIDMLDHHCWEQNQKPNCSSSSSMSQYDFVYMPFDFIREMNMGYAFVNFTSVNGVEAFKASWTGKGWAGSSKIRLITRAKLQGIEQCKKHFERSVFYCQSKEFLPVQFCPPRNGSNGNACKMNTVGNWVHDDS